MTVSDVVLLLSDTDVFSVVKEEVGIWKHQPADRQCSKCIEPTLSECERCLTIDDNDLTLNEKLVFNGSKTDFFEPLLTEYEKKIGGDFARQMAKNRHIVQSFQVKRLSLSQKKIVVIDPEMRLEHIS